MISRLPPLYDGRLFTPPSVVWKNYKHLLPALALNAGIGRKSGGVELSDIDIIPRILVRVCPVTLWWWCLMGISADAEMEPVISPNTRLYSVFTHSCLEAVQPQSSAVRHWAALWSYWNSRLLRASNEVLFETVDAVRFSLNSFCIVGKPTIDSDSLFLWVYWNEILHTQTWLVWLPSSFASYKIIQSSLSVSHPLICFTTLMSCCSNSTTHLS